MNLQEFELAKMRGDFKVFLTLVWRELNLPNLPELSSLLLITYSTDLSVYRSLHFVV